LTVLAPKGTGSEATDPWFRAEAVFDDANLVSFTGLAPLLARAERAGQSELIGERVWIDPTATKVESAGANPVGKLTSIIAGMAAGADCIDDLDVVRSGGMRRLFAGVYAATTLGQFLRECTHGHTQLPRCCAPIWSTCSPSPVAARPRAAGIDRH
jgi:hypothetical protein